MSNCKVDPGWLYLRVTKRASVAGAETGRGSMQETRLEVRRRKRSFRVWSAGDGSLDIGSRAARSDEMAVIPGRDVTRFVF